MSDFRWFGGAFPGVRVDPARRTTPGNPTRTHAAILITTTPGGRTENLTFRDIASDGLAGAAVTVLGAEKNGQRPRSGDFRAERDRRELHAAAEREVHVGLRLSVANHCLARRLHARRTRAGGEDISAAICCAGRCGWQAGDDRVFFDNAAPLPVSKRRDGVGCVAGHGLVCFFGDVLPTNLVRGRQYFVVESTPEFIRIAEQPGGAAAPFRRAPPGRRPS